MNRKQDQIVAPGPSVVFATEQAKEQIVADISNRYQQASHFAAARWTVATQKGEEIAQLQAEVNEKLAWIDQRTAEQRLAEGEAQNARDVAKGLADLLATAGVQIPPFGGELSHNPDGAIRNIGAAHDELERAGGHS